LLAGASLTLLTAYLLGRLLARRLEPELQFALGAATLAHLVFAAGWLGLLRPALLWPAALALCAFSLWRDGLPRPALKPRWWWLLFAPLAVLLTANAMMPETNPDGYTYHLGLAQEWLREGRFPTRVGFYEMLPQQAELLFAFAGVEAARLVHLGFLAALCSLAARMSGSWAPPLMTASTPVVAVCASAAYNDVMLAFYALAAFRALQLGAERTGALLAGACYAVKLTGGLYAALAALWLLWRKRPAAAALTAVFAAPWLARNALLAQNPFAPLFNAWFPNEHFHLSAERALTAYLTSYSLPPAELARQLLFGGPVLGGYLGIAFLAAPLLLFSRAGRKWLAPATLAALPWFANSGARFLIPAVPFAALGLPAPVALVQAGAFWLHRPADAWRIRRLPDPREPRESYLARELPEYAVAGLLNRHTKPGERVLDLAGAPTAYIHALALAPWQHAAAGRAAAALTYPQTQYEGRFQFPPRQVRELRIAVSAGPQPFRIQEIAAARLPDEIAATRHTAETPLAFDNNRTSGWSTWAPARAGDGVTLRYRAPVTLDSLAVTVADPWEGMRITLDLDGRRLPAEPSYRPLPALNLRAKSLRAVRREGFRYLLVRDAPEGYGLTGADMAARPRDWGLECLGNAGNVHLYRVP
jgi:hypothetical protein